MCVFLMIPLVGSAVLPVQAGCFGWPLSAAWASRKQPKWPGYLSTWCLILQPKLVQWWQPQISQQQERAGLCMSISQVPACVRNVIPAKSCHGVKPRFEVEKQIWPPNQRSRNPAWQRARIQVGGVCGHIVICDTSPTSPPVCCWSF